MRPALALTSCCDGLACHVEPRPNALFDPAWLGRVVGEKQAELLRGYRAVLFAEVDEIVLPREGSLRQLVRRCRWLAEQAILAD